MSTTSNASAPFDLIDEQKSQTDLHYRFFKDNFGDLEPEMDNTDDMPGFVFPKLGEMGYLGATVSEEYGGADLDFLNACLLGEEAARVNPAIALSYIAHDNLCVNNIYRNANDDLRQKYLPGLCDGSKVGALGLTEPGAGSDALGSMATTARREGDHYYLNGSKIFITNGPIADVILVYAKTDKERGAHGISAFIVEKDFPGFKVAQKLNKMGFRGSPTAELVFEDCKVPAENLVGKENAGVKIVMSGLDLERASVAFICLGIARRALELSIEYSKIRQQFQQPIANFQMIQKKLSDMYTEIEAARALAYRTAAMCDGLEEGAGGRGDIHMLTAASIFQAAKCCSFVLDEAVQIHGGSGYMRDTEINRLYRTGKVLEVGAGTQEVRKIIIADELIKR